ncbi:unnamed protein product, partial [Ixodes pacificus]
MPERRMVRVGETKQRKASSRPSLSRARCTSRGSFTAPSISSNRLRLVAPRSSPSHRLHRNCIKMPTVEIDAHRMTDDRRGTKCCTMHGRFIHSFSCTSETSACARPMGNRCGATSLKQEWSNERPPWPQK